MEQENVLQLQHFVPILLAIWNGITKDNILLET
jgi:hypothetical protein